MLKDYPNKSRIAFKRLHLLRGHLQIACATLPIQILQTSTKAELFDAGHAGSTCCCQREFFGYCFTWACCPLDNAVCCDDQVHCCPHDLPVCDTTIGRCLKKEGSLLESTEMYSKTPAMKVCYSQQSLDYRPQK